LLGQQVAHLLNGLKDAGQHEVVFSAEQLSSGIYFYQLKSDGCVETKKFVLLR
ncbi:MAG: T9SS type A sorting domain-containing protein, partial [Ignavibacteriae bacterium]|nr:T9SS type A sorting domain-containing protein [Ignavibacteriota bacterium]